MQEKESAKKTVCGETRISKPQQKNESKLQIWLSKKNGKANN